MSELDDFLAGALAREIKAEEALHKGGPEPRLQMWSTNDPVTVFGALGINKVGTAEVTPAFRWLATQFSSNADWSFELVAAGVSGDLAYTVGFERHTTSLSGGPVEPHVLRVTQVYRRENGEWKIVHRHGDTLPVDQSPPAEASTT